MKIRSSLLGATVLVLLLTAGAAQSLSGSNTVYTDDIVDGQVYAKDIANNAISDAKVYPNSIPGSDIRNGTLSEADLAPNAVTGAKVAEDSLTGADIDESSLDLSQPIVKSADFTCDVSPGGGDAACGEVTVTMSTPGVIYHHVTDLGDSDWDIEQDDARVDGVANSDFTFVGAGEHTVEAYGDCSTDPDFNPECDAEIAVRIQVLAVPATQQ